MFVFFLGGGGLGGEKTKKKVSLLSNYGTKFATNFQVLEAYQ